MDRPVPCCSSAASLLVRSDRARKYTAYRTDISPVGRICKVQSCSSHAVEAQIISSSKTVKTGQSPSGFGFVGRSSASLACLPSAAYSAIDSAGTHHVGAYSDNHLFDCYSRRDLLSSSRLAVVAGGSDH